MQLTLFELQPPRTERRWERMCRHEPRLRRLERLAIVRAGDRDVHRAWSTINSELRRLAGWFGYSALVSSQADYDCGYKHLMQVFFDAARHPPSCDPFP